MQPIGEGVVVLLALLVIMLSAPAAAAGTTRAIDIRTICTIPVETIAPLSAGGASRVENGIPEQPSAVDVGLASPLRRRWT